MFTTYICLYMFPIYSVYSMTHMFSLLNSDFTRRLAPRRNPVKGGRFLRRRSGSRARSREFSTVSVWQSQSPWIVHLVVSNMTG